VADVVADLMFALGHAHAARGLSQSVSVEEGAIFTGDREDLEEMLGNLIENAHRWARSAVSVSARVCGGELCITVADDGPGFPASGSLGGSSCEADLRQGAKSGDQGLGLVITREIAAAYGGKLRLDSPVGGGATVALHFPRDAE
jgi:signal transduction histidine kinase